MEKNNYKKIIFNLLAIMFLVFCQVGFLSALPLGLSDLNLALVSIIFILAMTDQKNALSFSLGVGLLMDIFSFQPFGVHLLSFAATVTVLQLLLSRYFTNRSFYTFLALAFSATVVYQAAIMASQRFFSFVSPVEIAGLDRQLLAGFGRALVFNLLFSAVLFYALNFFTNRFKTVFLSKSHAGT